MRSAGCIVNDILDKEFDAKVFRTKDRPIATNDYLKYLCIALIALLLKLLEFIVST